MNPMRFLPHPHWWAATRINLLTYTPTEQRCRICGEHRYHLYRDRFGAFSDGTRWRQGKYPEEFKAENGYRP